MGEKSLAAKLLEGFELDEAKFCPKTYRLAKALFGKLDKSTREFPVSSTNSYYDYPPRKKLCVRVSTHRPDPEWIVNEYNKPAHPYSKMFVVYTGTDISSQSQLDAVLNAIKNKLKNDFSIEMEFGSYLFTGDVPIDIKSDDQSITFIRAKYECLRKSLNIIAMKSCNEFYSVPRLGFIQPNGSYLDANDYGTYDHSIMSALMLKEKKPSPQISIDVMRRGYLRFKKSGESGGAVVQLETYPTKSQLATIRDVIDYVGKGTVEVTKDLMFVDYMTLSRDTLDADMRKLEALLNKVKPPQPKTS